MNQLVELLHSGNYTLVVSNGDAYTFTQRGVKDLYAILENTPLLLKGASVADKVIGKAAAALMVLGGVREIYADVISSNALSILDTSDLKVSYSLAVPHIVNRAGDGWCPLETLCKECLTAEECYKKVSSFIDNQN